MKGESAKLVMCVTNTVAANWTANVLLAIGEKPAMVEEPSEAAALARVADAALINVGTVHARQAEVMRAAIRQLAARHAPWVLDPVAAHILPYRRQLVKEFLAAGPALVRGNRAEIDALGIADVTTLATDSIDTIASPDGTRRTVSGGTPMLQNVTATGCAQGAICAAFLAHGRIPVEAAYEASILMKRAGERAYAAAQAPGSFQIALLDALWEMTR